MIRSNFPAGGSAAPTGTTAVARPNHFVPGLFTATCLFTGLGLLGATVLRQLLAAGGNGYVLVDPDRFERGDLGSACGPEEIGALRTDALRTRLARRGARVFGTATALDDLGPPPAQPCYVVVGSEDAEDVRAAHAYAANHGLPLFRVATRPSRGEFALIARRYDRPELASPRCPRCDARSTAFSDAGRLDAPSHEALETAAAGWITIAIGASLRG